MLGYRSHRYWWSITASLGREQIFNSRLVVCLFQQDRHFVPSLTSPWATGTEMYSRRVCQERGNGEYPVSQRPDWQIDLKSPVNSSPPLVSWKVARMLEVALIINLERFPAFRVAFEPEAIKWDLDPEPFSTRWKEVSKGG